MSCVARLAPNTTPELRVREWVGRGTTGFAVGGGAGEVDRSTDARRGMAAPTSYLRRSTWTDGALRPGARGGWLLLRAILVELDPHSVRVGNERESLVSLLERWDSHSTPERQQPRDASIEVLNAEAEMVELVPFPIRWVPRVVVELQHRARHRVTQFLPDPAGSHAARSFGPESQALRVEPDRPSEFVYTNPSVLKRHLFPGAATGGDVPNEHDTDG